MKSGLLTSERNRPPELWRDVYLKTLQSAKDYVKHASDRTVLSLQLPEKPSLCWAQPPARTVEAASSQQRSLTCDSGPPCWLLSLCQVIQFWWKNGHEVWRGGRLMRMGLGRVCWAADIKATSTLYSGSHAVFSNCFQNVLFYLSCCPNRVGVPIAYCFIIIKINKKSLIFLKLGRETYKAELNQNMNFPK